MPKAPTLPLRGIFRPLPHTLSLSCHAQYQLPIEESQNNMAPRLTPQSGGGIERTEACRNEKLSDGSRMAWPAADAGLGGCIRPTTPRATDGRVRCGRNETSRVGGIPRAMIDGGRPPNAKKRCHARPKAGPQPSAVMQACDGLGRTAARSHTKVLRAAAGRPSRPRLRTSTCCPAFGRT